MYDLPPLEQVVMRSASVIGPDRGKSPRRGCWRTGCCSGGRILLDRRAERVESAVVSSVFLGNALRYRPGALKLRRSVKVCALLAAMKLEATARAGPFGVKPGLQNGAAI